MFKSTHQIRALTIAFVVGIGFIVMAVKFWDTSSSELLAQLLSVVFVLLVLIGIAALLAWVLRKILQRISKK